MTLTDYKKIKVHTDSDGNEITEFLEKALTVVKTPKRIETIKIVKSDPRFGYFKILYDSGKSVPNLEGQFSSRIQAFKSLMNEIKKMEMTREAKSQDRWGDKPIPTVEKKKRRGRPKKNANNVNQSLDLS